MPIGCPPSRPNPTTSSAANSGLISKNESSSTMPSMISCTSKGTDSSAGTQSSANSTAGRSAADSGAGSRQHVGRYEKNSFACSIASGSSTARLSPHPETVACIRAPPISSNDTLSPTTISAIRGEPRYIDALPSTMITTSQNAGM